MTVVRDPSGIFYRKVGLGPPIVFVHGALSDYRSWRRQWPAFAEDFGAIAVSLPGCHPDTPSLEKLSAEDHVLALMRFIESLGETVILVGHSRGGRICLELAARSRRLLRGLVLFEPGGVTEADFFGESTIAPPARTRNDLLGAVQRLVHAGNVDEALEKYIDEGHGPSTWVSLPADVRRMFCDNAATIDMMRVDATIPLSRHKAASIDIPCLLIGGRESPLSFARILATLRAAMRQTTRVELPGANHFAHELLPGPFNESVRAFALDLGL